MTLSGIPKYLLRRAAALPENAAARETLLKAAGRATAPSRHPTPREPESAQQRASSAAGDALRVVLPIPDPGLSPNARIHWAKKQRLIRETRQRACFLAKKAIAEHPIFRGQAPWWERASVKIIFRYAIQRRRDADTALASCKAILDGMADAGVVANDSGFSFEPVEMQVDRENPRVELFVHRSP